MKAIVIVWTATQIRPISGWRRMWLFGSKGGQIGYLNLFLPSFLSFPMQNLPTRGGGSWLRISPPPLSTSLHMDTLSMNIIFKISISTFLIFLFSSKKKKQKNPDCSQKHNKTRVLLKRNQWVGLKKPGFFQPCRQVQTEDYNIKIMRA